MCGRIKKSASLFVLCSGFRHWSGQALRRLASPVAIGVDKIPLSVMPCDADDYVEM